jgi:cell volume regulation protein A
VYIILISFAATAALAFLLSKINHHVKFAPIIFLIILIYTVAKYFHLPALIFVLVLGLFLGNFDIAGENRFIKLLKPEILDKEVHKFKELVIEATFLVRSIFFILFGFLMKTSEILDTKTLGWAAGIVSLIFTIRAIQLYVTKMDMLPYLFIAPRGLITILLFLAIPSTYFMPLVSISLVIQIVIFTALFMMLGMIFKRKDEVGEVIIS